MSETAKTILLVEDEAIISLLRSAWLKREGYNVICAQSGEEAVDTIYSQKSVIDLILMDIDLGEGIDGTRASEIILCNYNVPILFLSSHTEKEIVEKTEKISSYGYVVKDSTNTVLLASMKMAFKLHKAYQELIEHDYWINESQAIGRVGSYLLNFSTGIWESSPIFDYIFGIDKTYDKSVEGWLALVHPKDKQMMNEYFEQIIIKHENFDKDYRILRPNDSTILWMHGRGAVTYNDQGIPLKMVGTIEDITDKKLARKSINDLAEQYKVLSNTSMDGYYLVDMSGKILDVNDSYLKVLGYSREEFLTLSVADIEALENQEIIENRIRKIIAQGYDRFESKHRRKDGTIVEVENSVTLMPHAERIACFMRDITEKKEAEEKLRNVAKERDVLLHELQHRIKNNLTALSNLLAISQEGLSEQKAKDIFTETQNRIRTMTRIYENLYNSAHPDSIELDSYITDLAGALVKTYSLSPEKVELVTNLEKVIIDSKRASALGLILNELLSNAMKYAFGRSEQGIIEIELKQNNDNVILKVADNGISLPAEYDFEKAESIGLKLVMLLTEQINGQVILSNNNGLSVEISFGMNPLSGL
ncbi:MAG: PAS domain S-box protein [Ignavibacteria bacterium]